MTITEASINPRRQAPVLTSTLPLLMDAVADPEGCLKDVAAVVVHDQGLSSRVLGLANSAQFGLSRRVAEVDQAISLIGTATVQTLAIASATALLDRDGPLGDRQTHALEVGCAARLLAPRVDVARADAFAAGLLHDVGELLLLQARPTEYTELFSTFAGHQHQLQVEKEHFGTDHALCGAEHLLEWRVPDVIADAVADHHDPFHTSDPCTIVVAAADELCAEEPGRRHALDLLEIDDDLADGLRHDARAAAEELTGIFV